MSPATQSAPDVSRSTSPFKRTRARKRKEIQRALLRKYAEVGQVMLAANILGIDRSAHNRWKREDPEYCRKVEKIEARLRAHPPATLVPRRLKIKEIYLQKRRANQRGFLEIFAKTGSLKLTAKALKFKSSCHSSHHRWMQNDSEYRKNFQNAKLRAPRRVYALSTQTLANYRKETQKLQDAFLSSFAKTGRLYKAAEETGIHRATHCRWIREDPEYRRKFEKIKARLRGNPPATLVPIRRSFYGQKKRTRPNGLGSVKPIKDGFRITSTHTVDGKRQQVSEILHGVTKEEAWLHVQNKYRMDPPRVGPLRHGHFPSIKSLLSNTPGPPLPGVKPFTSVNRANRRWGGGTIRKVAQSLVIGWTDLDGRVNSENIGNATQEEAEVLLNQRTAPRFAIAEELKQVKLDRVHQWRQAGRALETKALPDPKQPALSTPAPKAPGVPAGGKEHPRYQWIEKQRVFLGKAVRKYRKTQKICGFLDRPEIHFPIPQGVWPVEITTWTAALKNKECRTYIYNLFSRCRRQHPT